MNGRAGELAGHRRTLAKGRVAAGLALLALTGHLSASANAEPLREQALVKSKVPSLKRRPGWTLLKKSVVRSPDDKHLAYRLSKNNDDRQVVVYDDKAGFAGYDILGPTFSPDSKRLAYFLLTYHGWRLFVDNKLQSDLLNPVSAPMFTPDSERIAYWSRRGKRSFLVLDNEAQAAYDRVRRDSLVFSPDSYHVAYLAYRYPRWVLVIDSRELPIDSGRVGGLRFSEDSSQVFFTVYPRTSPSVGEQERTSRPHDHDRQVSSHQHRARAGRTR